MMKIVYSKECEKAVKQVVEAVSYGAPACRARSAVKYIDPKLRVKATARFRPKGNDTCIEVLLNIGRPNYAERKFVKECVKAEEPFPVKKLQLTYWPDRKKK